MLVAEPLFMRLSLYQDQFTLKNDLQEERSLQYVCCSCGNVKSPGDDLEARSEWWHPLKEKKKSKIINLKV